MLPYVQLQNMDIHYFLELHIIISQLYSICSVEVKCVWLWVDQLGETIIYPHAEPGSALAWYNVYKMYTSSNCDINQSPQLAGI
jgi:hypothetical protein